jgi:putative transposase
MPRKAIVAPGGLVYHVLNRAAGKMHRFRKQDDFGAFQRVMVEAHQGQPIRILSELFPAGSFLPLLAR